MLSNIIKNLSLNSSFRFFSVFNCYSFFNFIGSSSREFVFLRNSHLYYNKFFSFFINGTISNNLYYQLKSPFFVVDVCSFLSSNGVISFHVLDNLDSHSKLFRHLMLDLKRSPGREAFPGDVFYLHSRLLERYGKLNYFYNFGSITGIPILEISQNDLTKYIATNLISITDGQ